MIIRRMLQNKTCLFFAETAADTEDTMTVVIWLVKNLLYCVDCICCRFCGNRWEALLLDRSLWFSTVRVNIHLFFDNMEK